MPTIKYPRPLKRGDTIGITAPSSGIGKQLEQRLEYCLRYLDELGYATRVGQCLYSNAVVSAPAAERASELMAMILDPDIAAIVPPWGGELLINILPHLDFDALTSAPPKWIVGYSDLTTFMLPYTVMAGVSTLHGSNLLETPIHAVAMHRHWCDVLPLSVSSSFTQHQSSVKRSAFENWIDHPHASTWICAEPAEWKALHHEMDPSYVCSITGRLIGGCLDVISMLAGSAYGALDQFAQQYAPEGLLVYLENADQDTAGFSRMLSAMKLAGWFEHANAILLGRSSGAQHREYILRDAIMDALGDLSIPIIYEMDIGHIPPQMVILNGAVAELRFSPAVRSLTQWLA